jgi:protein-S-isoprenylcysteine O-methyltransferase Ste14
MPIWGIGIKLIMSSVLYALLAILITYSYPDLFIMRNIPYINLLITSLPLFFIGVLYLAISGRKIVTDFKKDILIKDGIFAYVRNPIYSAWILFIIPALALLSKSWLVLSTPIFSYIAFKILIKKEDSCLERLFGEEYLRYRSEVNEIIPKFKISNENIALNSLIW